MGNENYVLILANGMPSENCLSGIFELDQAKALKNQGQNVIFLALDLRSFRRKRPYGVHKFESDGVLCYHVSFPLGNVPLSLFKLIGLRVLEKTYKRIVRENGSPNLIHAHFTDMGYLVGLLKKKHNIKIVLTEHNSAVNKAIVDKKTLKMARSAYYCADAVISVSRALSKSIERIYDTNIFVIPNIVNLQMFTKRKEFCTHVGYRFVSVGNLLEIKNYPTLIRAFCIAFQKEDDVSLEIIGDGSEYKKLKTLIEELGAEKKIKLLGRKTREEIAEVFYESDAFVLLSLAETFGVAFIEAMACGLPVIASCCGGPEDFVVKDNGFLVSVNDIEATVKALLEIRYTKFDKAAIADFAVKNFSGHEVSKKIINIYKMVGDLA